LDSRCRGAGQRAMRVCRPMHSVRYDAHRAVALSLYRRMRPHYIFNILSRRQCRHANGGGQEEPGLPPFSFCGRPLNWKDWPCQHPKKANCNRPTLVRERRLVPQRQFVCGRTAAGSCLPKSPAIPSVHVKERGAAPCCASMPGRAAVVTRRTNRHDITETA
jgi:hypothetical protein